LLASEGSDDYIKVAADGKEGLGVTFSLLFAFTKTVV